MRGYLIDLDHALESVYATSPLHDNRPASTSATGLGTPWEPRTQERQDQIASERWSAAMKGQDVAQELMTLVRRFDRLTVGR
jgi:hypothetical protein